jgi:hypothetical protein
MITIKNFENYELCHTNMMIFSKHSSPFVAIKFHREGAHVYFFLFKNGKRFRKTLWEIMVENWDKLREEIERDLINRGRFPEQSHHNTIN